MCNIKRTILLSLVFLLTLGAWAQGVSVEKAQNRAFSFVKAELARRMPAHEPGVKLEDLRLAYTSIRPADQKVCYYVFNRKDNGGFVIVGGDESAEEILAYSDYGAFDYDNIPDGFKWWLSLYDEQISFAMDKTSPEENAKRKAAHKAAQNKKNSIAAMVTTEWYQDAPYSNAIPGDTCLTGCVATAMAQIMKYHNYPQTGAGSHSYTHNGATYSADFESTQYDWANMTNTYSSASTDAEKDAVATLMYHCGVSVDMAYGKDGSGASEFEVCKAFCSYFRYSNAVHYEKREFYSDADWEDMIYAELADGRPVFYTGITKTDGAHAFLCDGYRTMGNMFHFNWGWGGGWNCYCVMSGTDAVKPAGADAFCNSQSVTVGIIPEEGGVESPNVKNAADDLVLKDGDVEYKNYDYVHDVTRSKKMLSLSLTLWNLCTTLTDFSVGVKATNTDNGDVYYMPYEDTSMNRYYVWEYSIPFNVNSLPNGTYEIRAVARRVGSSDNDDWCEIGEHPSAVIPTVTVTNSVDPALKLVSTPYFEDEVAWKENMTLHLPICNTSSAAVTRNCTVTIGKEGTNVYMAYGLNVSLAPGDTCDYVMYLRSEAASFETGKDVSIELNFYQDEIWMVPFNIAKGIYTYKPATSMTANPGFNTLIMPYRTAVPEGISVFTVVALNDSVLELADADEIKADTPYIIFNETSDDITLSCPAFTPSADHITDESGLLTGLAKAGQVPAGAYVLQTVNGVQAFCRNSAATRGKIHSCYLTLPESEASTIYLGQSATGIDELPAFESVRIEGIYSANGMKVQALQRGLNIIRSSDGKCRKIMVR